jgi:hypothetical protein
MKYKDISHDKWQRIVNSPANSNCECTISPGAALYNGHFPSDIASRPIEDFVRVAVLLS